MHYNHIIFPLFAMISFTSCLNLNRRAKCSAFIGLFPEYECVQENRIGIGSKGVAFQISKRGVMFILKVQSLLPNPEKARAEIKFLQKLAPSPFVVTLIEYKEDDKTVYEILEFGSRGDLQNFILQQQDELALNIKKSLSLFLQLLNAMQYIHSKDIIHADLKPENIIVTEDYKLKVIDFDLAINKGDKSSGRGTKAFMDPRILLKYGKEKMPFDEKIDVYSLGVILYYMTQKQVPFKHSEEQSIEEALASHNYFFPKGTSVNLIKIIDACLRMDAKERKTIAELQEMTILALNTEDTFLEHPILVSNSDKNTHILGSKSDKEKVEQDFIDRINRQSHISNYMEIIFITSLVFFVIPFSIWFATRYLFKEEEQLSQQLVFEQDQHHRQADMEAQFNPDHQPMATP